MNEFASKFRLEIYDDLRQGKAPRAGTFDSAVLAEALTKGSPQMGPTRYRPNSVVTEFIFPDSAGGSVVLAVSVETPEPIVYLPVPSWVVESIWQGHIEGSYHFRSQAERLLQELTASLEPGQNEALFDKQTVIGKA